MNKSGKLLLSIKSLFEDVGHSLNRVSKHMNSDREVGVISSERTHDDVDNGGDGHKLTPHELNQRHRKLKQDIKSAGYSYTALHGEYHGNKERSLMVFGKDRGKDTGLKDFLIKKGKELGQDSILHKPHDKSTPDLHFSFDRNGSKVGDNFPLGRMRFNRTGKFGATALSLGQKDKKNNLTPASKKSFTFSDGREIKKPKAGKLKQSLTTAGLVKDNSVWPS